MDKILRKIIESNPMFIEYGGAIDDERVINCVINDIKSGKIKGVTFDRIEDYEF